MKRSGLYSSCLTARCSRKACHPPERQDGNRRRPDDAEELRGLRGGLMNASQQDQRDRQGMQFYFQK
jgi:hypothetical protein